jgi:hypothetical protein
MGMLPVWVSPRFFLAVRSGNRMTAVLAFFATTPQQPPPELLEVMAQIGVSGM